MTEVSLNVQKWWGEVKVQVPKKVKATATFLTELWKGIVLRLFSTEKGLKNLSPERVKKLSNIEIRLLTVKQLQAIGVDRFSETQVRQLPADFFVKYKKVEQVSSLIGKLTAGQIDALLAKMKNNDQKTTKFAASITATQLKSVNQTCAAQLVSHLSEDKKKEFWSTNDISVRAVVYSNTQSKEAYENDIGSYSKENLTSFLLKLPKDQVLPLLRKLSSDKISELLEHVYTAADNEKMKEQIGQPFFDDKECLDNQLPNLTASSLFKLFQAIVDKGEFSDEVRFKLIDTLKERHKTDVLTSPPELLVPLLLKFKEQNVPLLLRKMEAENLSALLIYVYNNKENAQDLQKQHIGQSFFKDKVCVESKLPHLTEDCLNQLIEVIKLQLNGSTIQVSNTGAFPDETKLALLDSFLEKEKPDLAQCMSVYPTTLFETYLNGAYDEKKKIKCLNALLTSPQHAKIIEGRFKSFGNPMDALNTIKNLSPDQIRSYWKEFQGDKTFTVTTKNKNVIRSEFHLQKNNVAKVTNISNLTKDIFLWVLPMLSDELKDASLLKKQIKNERGSYEGYIKAICSEPNSQKGAQLKILTTQHPGIVPLAMKEALEIELQDDLLKIFLNGRVKGSLGDLFNALKEACFMTNTSYEERMAVIVPEDERVNFFVSTLIREKFLGFSFIANKVRHVNSDVSSSVFTELLKLLASLEKFFEDFKTKPVGDNSIIKLNEDFTRVNSFKALLAELDSTKHGKLNYTKLTEIRSYLAENLKRAVEAVERSTEEAACVSYFRKEVEIFGKYPRVKHLRALVLSNGIRVYEGGSKDGTIFRLNFYLKENNVS